MSNPYNVMLTTFIRVLVVRLFAKTKNSAAFTLFLVKIIRVLAAFLFFSAQTSVACNLILMQYVCRPS